MKKNILFLIAITLLAFTSCKVEEPTLGIAPTAADAAYTYKASTISPNILEFTAARTDIVAVWNFGNGTTAEGPSGTAIYPNKGTYAVTLTVFTSGGSASRTDSIIIVADDPTLLSDPLFKMISGGVDSLNGKTWVLDSAYAGHFGVGPNPPSALGLIPEWYEAGANEKSNAGLYSDRYVFNIAAFGFDMITNGSSYVHTDFKDDFPGSYQNKGDYTAPLANQLGENWRLDYAAGSDTTITLSGNSFMGMFTKVKTYRILSITEDEMFLRYLHEGNPMLSWYLRLVRAGFDSGSGAGPVGASLPIDFEGSTLPTFEGFGNSTADVIDNPDARGVNTSAKVLETVHGNEVWAGVSVILDQALDFSSDTTISVNVWAPTAGTIRIKIEDQNDNNTAIEKDVVVPVAFTWIKVSVGFSGASSGTYDKIALFPGWDVANAGTFYLDNLKQE